MFRPCGKGQVAAPAPGYGMATRRRTDEASSQATTNVMPVDDTWANRDLPVLEAVVRWFDDADAGMMNWPDIVEWSGLDEDSVKRALRALDSADPPYINVVGDASALYPTSLAGVTERARRAVGAWPTPERLADQLVAALNAAADAEDDPERSGWLRRTAAWFGTAGRDFAVQVGATVLTKSTGLG